MCIYVEGNNFLPSITSVPDISFLHYVDRESEEGSVTLSSYFLKINCHVFILSEPKIPENNEETEILILSQSLCIICVLTQFLGSFFFSMRLEGSPTF